MCCACSTNAQGSCPRIEPEGGLLYVYQPRACRTYVPRTACPAAARLLTLTLTLTRTLTLTYP